MMDRLTERFSNGQAASYWCGSNCKYDHKYCRENLENCPAMEDILEKLAYYEDLEEATRLMKLPCAVGDTVWAITWAFNGKEIVNSIISRKIDGFIGIGFNPSCMISKEPYRMDFASSEFGKTVFLTREEAEAALKECETEWTF